MTIDFKYNVTANDGVKQSITAFVEGYDPLVATKDHPNFQRIIDTLAGLVGTAESYEAVQELFAMEKMVIRKLEDQGLSERVAITKGQLTLDRDPMHGLIADHILKLTMADQNVAPVVRFLEKVSTNLEQQSRDALYAWLSQAGLTLCEDGDFIGYKGVNKTHAPDPTINREGPGQPPAVARYLSSSSGHAYVNGVEHRGHIPTGPNTVVEMPRSEVTFDPNQSCSAGLHVGTYSYAQGFGNVNLVVKVNPRDVVSVPRNEHMKMRVCRYMVMHEVTAPLASYDPSTLVAKIKVDIGTSAARDVVEKAKAKKEAPKVEPKPKPKPTKKAAAKAAKAKRLKKVAAGYEADEKLPEFYEDFKLAHFNRLSLADLKWLVAQWELTFPARASKQVLIGALNKEAARRRRVWKEQQSK